MAEADILTCAMSVENFSELCSLVGPDGFGFPLGGEFGGTGTWVRGKYYQTGGGWIEVIEQYDNPQPWWNIILTVQDVPEWHARLVSAGYHPDDIQETVIERVHFRVETPSGVKFRVRSIAEERPMDVPLIFTTRPNGPNVLHFSICWWPEDWAADYRFLSEGLGLVTSRGRTEPGRRVAFMRGAYGGHGIVEIQDPDNSPYTHPGLHWRLALMVDDVSAFHERLTARGKNATAIEEVGGQVRFHAFTAKPTAGPEIFVAEVPQGILRGLSGQPLGLEKAQ